MPYDTCKVLDCTTTGHMTAGMCKSCYSWIKRNPGKNPVGRQRKRPKGKILDDLTNAAYSDKDECIFLKGYKGRPYVTIDGETSPGARVVWTIKNGDPGKLHVLHSCNGGSGDHGCININHLYLGTSSQNARDAFNSGRRTISDRRGENNTYSKLTKDQIRQIRQIYKTNKYTQKQIGDIFGVSDNTICNIINRKLWGWLD